MRNKKGQFESELKEPVLFQFWIEKVDRSWLRQEAKKRNFSIAKLIRHLIQQAKKVIK